MYRVILFHLFITTNYLILIHIMIIGSKLGLGGGLVQTRNQVNLLVWLSLIQSSVFDVWCCSVGFKVFLCVFCSTVF